jgi:hypothetical protein
VPVFCSQFSASAVHKGQSRSTAVGNFRVRVGTRTQDLESKIFWIRGPQMQNILPSAVLNANFFEITAKEHLRGSRITAGSRQAVGVRVSKGVGWGKEHAVRLIRVRSSPSTRGAQCQIFCIRQSQMQNILDFDSLDQNLFDSTVLNVKSFAFHLVRCKISWISLATMGLVHARPLT